MGTKSTMAKVAEGLAILVKYWPNGDIAVGRDVIYAGGEIELATVSDSDKAKLQELDWFFADQYDCWAKNI